MSRPTPREMPENSTISHIKEKFVMSSPPDQHINQKRKAEKLELHINKIKKRTGKRHNVTHAAENGSAPETVSKAFLLPPKSSLYSPNDAGYHQNPLANPHIAVSRNVNPVLFKKAAGETHEPPLLQSPDPKKIYSVPEVLPENYCLSDSFFCLPLMENPAYCLKNDAPRNDCLRLRHNKFHQIPL